MTTLLETEQQFLVLWAEMEAEQAKLGPDWTDDQIDAWGDRLRPYQQRLEQSPCASIEDALVIMRHASRNSEAWHSPLVADALQQVATWLEPGAGFTCTDPRILRPCPFCGEREHLRIGDGDFERVPVVDGKVVEIEWKGSTAEGAEYVDSIHCMVCECIAPLDAWNHTRPASDYTLLRDFDPPEVEVETPDQRRAA
jgi:hypothetical protein